MIDLRPAATFFLFTILFLSYTRTRPSGGAWNGIVCDFDEIIAVQVASHQNFTTSTRSQLH